MDIVFICDEEYAVPTAVAIQSIKETNKFKKTIYVISPSLEKNTKELLNSLKDENTNIQVIIYNKQVDGRFKIENLHVSPTALIKFDLPEIFKEKDKILYLDSDILVKKDLRDLYNIDLANEYAAVVKDYKPLTYKPSQLIKLNLTHKAYFNSGVMLLNLDKLRKDNIREKLYYYRKNGINYFMDQDALNVVFKENVKYIDLKYNVISSTIGAFNKKELESYYHLNNIDSKNDIYNQAIIIHLTTKYKPWKYVNVPYSTEWMALYKKICKYNIKRDILDIKTREKIFSGIRVRISSRDLGIKQKVNINLTSYPARIDTIYKVIRSLQKQTIRVEKIILWLAKQQFLNGVLPKDLLNLQGKDFEIKWCPEDLRPHKKYYYAFLEFPDCINITVDDDLYYDRTTIESLLISYIEFPYAISANRVHEITFDEQGKINPYSKWKRAIQTTRYPSMNFFATGVGGVLYPPYLFTKDVLDKDNICKYCIDADDVWLKFNEIISNIPVVLATDKFKLNFIENTQDVALWKKNDTEKGNDLQIEDVVSFLIDEKKINFLSSYLNLMAINTRLVLPNRTEIGNNSNNISIEQKHLKKIDFLKNTKSYRIGRAITFIPRLLIKKYKTVTSKV